MMVLCREWSCAPEPPFSLLLSSDPEVGPLVPRMMAKMKGQPEPEPEPEPALAAAGGGGEAPLEAEVVD